MNTNSRYIGSVFFGLVVLLGTATSSYSQTYPSKEACEASCQTFRRQGRECVCYLIRKSLPPSSDLLRKSEQSPNNPEGGHTLLKHKSKDNNALIRRAKQEKVDSSAYYDQKSANYAVTDALLQNQRKLIQWLSNPASPNRLTLRATHQYGLGRGVRAGRTTVIDNLTQSTTTLVKADNEFGFIVLTSYPLVKP
jgi:hypothetical protein